MPKSDFLEQKILEHLYGLATWTAPSNLYFALFNVSPGDPGGGTEVAGGSYARVQKAAGASNFTYTSNTIVTDNAVTWPQASASWGAVEAVGVFDASTSGNLLVYASISTTIGNGDTFSLPSGTGFVHTED